MNNLFESVGIHVPEVLLPKAGLNLSKWSVIACDQFTSQPEYWQKVSEEVGSHPSTLRLIFPEIYLKDEDKEERIKKINETMENYLKEGILEPQEPCFVLVDRSTPKAASRKGLVIALDLEFYDYNKGSVSLIRATEGTVLERIPPRVKIRENAAIELPHIMVLIDDPGKTVIEPLFDKISEFDLLYDFELMMGGGHIKGYRIKDTKTLSEIAASLNKLKTVAEEKASRYGEGVAPLLFAVGDGNHSLASAKAHWENVKAALRAHKAGNDDGAVPVHPARYALAELVNLHDDGLVFEPIHRVLFGINAKNILLQIENCLEPGRIKCTLFGSRSSMEKAYGSMKKDICSEGKQNTHLLPFILEGEYGIMLVNNPDSELEVGTLQSVLDTLTSNDTSIEIDYIHGEDVVTELGSNKNSMGFYLPVMDKHMLFKTVMLNGVLPKKTFSMGEAEEKRYYLECRKIR